MTCKRVLTLITALACVVVWVLPGFVVPVDALESACNFTDKYFVQYMESLSYTHSAVHGSSNTGPYAVAIYDSYDSSVLARPNGFYRINLAGADAFSSVHRASVNHSFGAPGWADSDSDLRLQFSFHYSATLTEDPYGSYFLIEKIKNQGGAYISPTDLVLHTDLSFDLPDGYSFSRWGSLFFYFYDVDGTLLKKYTSFHADATTSGSYSLKGIRMAIPEGAAYYDFFYEFDFNDTDSSSEYWITMDDFSVDYLYAADDYYSESVTEPTDPTIDSGSTGDSGSSGSGTGNSGGSGSFDDSGIIDSVTSSADKIITEIGGDIENQTQQITDSIAAQNGILEQGFDDLYDISDDIYNNIDVTNDKLDDMTEEVKSIPEKILDGIKGLFVPDEQDMQEYNDKWDELLHSRFGALYESVDIISQVGAVFVDTEARNTVDFPSVTIPLAGVDFEFGGWEVQVIPDGFDVLVDMLKGMISLLATVAFVNALRNKFDRLMGGSG